MVNPVAPPRAEGVLAGAPLTEATRHSIQTGGKGLTTLLLQDLPPSCTRDGLVATLLGEGFDIDFAYVPCRFATGAAFGFAFINLTCGEEVARCWRWLESASDRGHAAGCRVAWAVTQGLDRNIERFRNSPLMHEHVADSMRPILLRAGRRIPFPSPTKPVKAPRCEHRNF